MFKTKIDIRRDFIEEGEIIEIESISLEGLFQEVTRVMKTKGFMEVRKSIQGNRHFYLIRGDAKGSGASLYPQVYQYYEKFKEWLRLIEA